MHIAAKRVFRLSLTVALSLAAAYGLAVTMPFMAPLFAVMFGAAPKPPMGPKGLLVLLVAICIMLSSGLLLIPVLAQYPAVGLMLVLLGLFFANYVTLNLGKAPVGAFLTIGITLISAMGLMAFEVAIVLINALCINIAVAVICLWIVYPLFPEEGAGAPPPPVPEPQQSSWLALRATLILFPSYLLVLTNPAAYAAIIMKAVALGQQTSETDVRVAGRELVGSTVMAGLLAALMWFCLKLAPTLWMYFLWALAFSMFVAAKFNGVLKTRFTPSFWVNVLITLLILIGPAVGDTDSGKDPYKASAVRIGLFIGVTLYAWLMLVFLEWWRARLERQRARKAL
jgi:Protein of unknown function (DUF2955)